METTPVAVTVFPDRARVTRQGHAALAVGIQKIDVGPLPMALQPDSVRATGQGTARVKLLGVGTRMINFTETPAEAAGALEKKIEVAEDDDRVWVAREAGLERQQAFVDGLASQSEMFARGLALKYRAPEEQGAIFDFVRQRLEQLQAERQEVARARRDLAKELDRLRRELRQVQAERPRQRFVATVELDVSAAGGFDLQLTYVVTGAAWTPLYDVRLRSAGLDLTYMARVNQQTGEDWPNVALTLSTAQPTLALIIPELAPWYIAPEPAYPMAAPARAGGAPKAGLFAAMAAMPQALGSGAEPPVPQPAAAPMAEAMIAEEATVSASGAALTYQLAARADISGTNEPRKVTVAVINFKPTLDYVTAPRREAVCYRRATVKNDSVYTLLPGPAQLFEGDEYLGATRLESVAPGQEFELALGADERLRVDRELSARDVDKTFMGDRRRIRYAYTINVENLRDGPQIVLVRDQLPVARNEQIKVKLETADPKPDEQTDLNQLEWKLVLDKAAKQKIRFEFSVEYPRTMDVNGLP